MGHQFSATQTTDHQSQFGSTGIDRKALRSCETDHQLFVSAIKSELSHRTQKIPSAHQMAGHLYISPRTFSRRLNKAGIDYRTIVSDVRKASAYELLIQTRYSIAQISKVLGYADNSNFTKAFKSWSGMSPLAYRKCFSED